MGSPAKVVARTNRQNGAPRTIDEIPQSMTYSPSAVAKYPHSTRTPVWLGHGIPCLSALTSPLLLARECCVTADV